MAEPEGREVPEWVTRAVARIARGFHYFPGKGADVAERELLDAYLRGQDAEHKIAADQQSTAPAPQHECACPCHTETRNCGNCRARKCDG